MDAKQQTSPPRGCTVLTNAVREKLRDAAAIADAFAELSHRATPMLPAKLLMLLDYDGTLTPIVPDPARALLSSAGREALRLLAKCCRVCIVTGRKYDTIRNFVDVPNVDFATSHGMQVWSADGTLRHEVGREYVPMLLRFETLIRERLEHTTGVLIENNEFCVSVHYRKVPEQERPEVERAIVEILNTVFAGHLLKRAGHLVHEIRPDYPWHKGTAVRWLIDRVRLEEHTSIIPVFVGDDVTDEDAFGELQRDAQAITVQVHSPQAPERATKAMYRLDNSAEVIEWLREITELMSSTSSARVGVQ